MKLAEKVLSLFESQDSWADMDKKTGKPVVVSKSGRNSRIVKTKDGKFIAEYDLSIHSELSEYTKKYERAR